jgi:hypothetical protein
LVVILSKGLADAMSNDVLFESTAIASSKKKAGWSASMGYSKPRATVQRGWIWFAGCGERLEPAEEFGRFERFGQKMQVPEFNAVILTNLRSGIPGQKKHS